MADTVLIVDDDEAVLTMLYKVIRSNGIEADTVASGEEALERTAQRTYDLILLDVNLMGMDGFQVVQTLRQRGVRTPIIIVSGRKEDYDTLYGLDIGADDYVTKPFSLAVLLAKTEALIRRSRGGGAETLACGAITLEPGRRACTVGGRLVALPPREYELLLCLMRNKGQVLRREQLLDKVWGIDFEGGDRAVDGRIKALRAALGPAGKQIRTVFKVGYKLEEGAHG